MRTKAADLRIEYPARGSTYCRQEYGVYEYGRFGRGSVLAGQTRRIFLGSFATLEEAQAAFPSATTSSCGFQPPFVGHLSPERDV